MAVGFKPSFHSLQLVPIFLGWFVYFLSWFPNHLSPTILRKYVWFVPSTGPRAIQLMVSLGWFWVLPGARDLQDVTTLSQALAERDQEAWFCLFFFGGERAWMQNWKNVIKLKQWWSWKKTQVIWDDFFDDLGVESGKDHKHTAKSSKVHKLWVLGVNEIYISQWVNEHAFKGRMEFDDKVFAWHWFDIWINLKIHLKKIKRWVILG